MTPKSFTFGSPITSLLYVLCVTLQTSAACTSSDWLVCPPTTPVTLSNWTLDALSGITLTNGLFSRSWITQASGVPTFGLWEFSSFLDGPPSTSLLRTLTPEASLTFNTSTIPVLVGGVSTSARNGSTNFTLIANNSATECTFVAEGPIDSLSSCMNACWTSSTCNILNWIPDFQGTGAADCVLKSCSNPFTNPQLQPYDGCLVYATAVPANPGGYLNDVNSGPFLNRTGLSKVGVLAPTPNALVFTNYEVGTPQPRFNFTPGTRGSSTKIQWPLNGILLAVHFTGAAGSGYEALDVVVHYEAYVGNPSITKWVTVSLLPNASSSSSSSTWWQLNGVEVERLGLSPTFSPLAPLAYNTQYDGSTAPLYPASGKINFLVDYYYASQVTWSNQDIQDGTPGSSQPMVSVTETPGLQFMLIPGSASTWTSLRVYELLFDDGPEQGSTVARFPSSETYYGCTLGPCTLGTGTPIEGGISERRGLTMKRFISMQAPQGLQSPLQNHLTASDSASIRASCDAMQSVGWEMLVLSYGSGADIESTDPAYIARMKGDIGYCNSKGIEVGVYDLIGWTRDPGNGWSALNADGSDSGNACFSSGFEVYLSNSFLSFANATGLTMVETDGPYAGYLCNNASHAHHNGLNNSVATQMRNMASIYTELQNAGIYVNAPDSYFMMGSSLQGIGYNEGTFRLPDVDLISLVQRQVIYDATFYTAPSMAWSQIPMETFNFNSPFDLVRFEQAVATQLGYGIATFIYQPDGGNFLPVPAVSPILSKWASWFKTYRTLVSAGDMIHVSRPDGQGLDTIVHVDASNTTLPGMIIVTNPTAADITTDMVIPLYYTGLAPGSTALVAWSNENPTSVLLDGRARVLLTQILVPARTMMWATVKGG